jgi:diguanylate cyclase (GGDEF)-like protein
VSAPKTRGVATLAGRIRFALLSVTLVAILVATVGALAVGSHYLLDQMRAHLRALASVTATHSEPALLFNDRDAAEEVLRGIPPEEGVIVAELRDASGRVVARVARPDATLPAAAIRALVHERATADIVVDGRRIGSVTLESAGEPLARGLAGLLVLDLLAALFVCLMVFAIERRLTGHITRPLTDLEAVIRSAREDRDFSRRAPPCGIAEIEALRTDFHGLLDEIRRRDEDLGRTHAVLKRLAFRDALTGLANRAMLESALLGALSGDPQGDERTGLLYFDVDSFKPVNDTFGHSTGDSLLKGLASRLKDALPAHAMPARIGGDEFVVLVSPVASEEALRALASKLDQALHAPMRIGPHVFHPGLSIGYALSGPPGMEGAELINRADRAMYLSKKQRRTAGDRTRWEEAREDTPRPVAVEEAH